MKKTVILFFGIFVIARLFGYYFGQNKIQMHKIDWVMLETLHFDIYYEKGDPQFGEIAALIAEEAYYYLKYFFFFKQKTAYEMLM